MWSYVTLDRPFTHISLKQFSLNFIQHLHSNLWSETEFLAVLSPRKPTEALTLWNWTWRFTETICFICPVHQWALNTVQKPEPSPGRPHFLSSEEEVWQADWMPMRASRPAVMCLMGRSGGWYCKHARNSNTTNWHFKRQKSGHPQNHLKDTLRCVQMEYHLSRPVKSSRHLLSYVPQHCHTWPLEMHCMGSKSTLFAFDPLCSWQTLFQKSLMVQQGALK